MRYITAILFLLVYITTYAQQPPDTLPSLIENELIKDNNAAKTKAIHDILKKNIFVKAVHSKTQVYAGEPFLVCYKLYTAYNSEARVIKQPVFDNCSVLELAIRKDPYPETIDGKVFHVFELRKVQLTALTAGTVETGTIAVESIVQISAGENSVAENFSITSLNEEQHIQVKALPAFTGEANAAHIPIGHFFLQTSVAENKTGTGEKNNLQIKISGDGNFASVYEPIVNWPAGVELFGSNSSSFLNQDDFPVTGYKVFDISFAGKAAGDIIIPPVQFSFFNPDTGQYQATESEPIYVSFTKSSFTATDYSSVTDYTNRRYLWIIAGIALAVIIVVILTGKIKKRKEIKEAVKKREEELVLAEKQKVVPYTKNTLLPAAETLYKEYTGHYFLSGAKEVLLSAMQAYTGIADKSESNLVNKTAAKNISVSLLCRQWLGEVNMLLYTQDHLETDNEKLYEQLKELIEMMCAE